ncbi:MAG: hypothetical protein KF889_13595 [Alphaproteobacteria bacterium]|nr:hypothetical protein [Alphaproteobacteria bacterium]MCW5738969.1 hypothetical protein [Alphaproteobacteria bacterium]
MGGTPVKLSGMLVQAARGGAATPAAARWETLGYLLDELARSRERGTVQAHLRALGGPRCGSDPRHPRLLVRIEPDGRRTLGRLEGRVFVPMKEGAGRPA